MSSNQKFPGESLPGKECKDKDYGNGPNEDPEETKNVRPENDLDVMSSPLLQNLPDKSNRSISVPAEEVDCAGRIGSPTMEEPRPSYSQNLEFCATLLRPDTADVVLHDLSIPDRIVIRRTKHADHVLIMGRSGCMLDPLLCPFETDDACKGFRGAGTRYLKAHLHAKHHLTNVQMNLACPCPPWFNKEKRTGKMKSCGRVRYDPYDDIMPHHVAERHQEYYEKMTRALCGMGGDNEEKVLKYNNFIIRRGRRAEFPLWTTDPTRPFPSQLIPEEVTIRTTIMNHQLRYLCNISPCHKEGFESCGAVKAHISIHHSRQLGSQTEFYHACPLYPKECPVKLVAIYHKLEAHVSAVHPELLGIHYTDEAKQKRSALVSQIDGATVGEAVTNTVQTDKGTPETAPTHLETYMCPVPKCEKYYHVRDFTVWHITTHHEELWNSS